MRAYLELTKPSITRLVLIATAAGFYLGSSGRLNVVLLLHTLIGTALSAGGTNALNQWWERDVDARMHRTRRRPLPSGRLRPDVALLFGYLLAAGGVAYLVAFVNLPTAFLAALTATSYVLVYTPLKARTWHATIVGAVPGAIPILGGWTAAGGQLEPAAWALFAILFIWQLPHFFALAWLYRDDYRRGGLSMLGVLDPTGRRTGLQCFGYTLLLLPISLLPSVFGVTGDLYAWAAAALGVGFVIAAVPMVRRPSAVWAKRLFLTSIAYLPVLLLFMVLDHRL